MTDDLTRVLGTGGPDDAVPRVAVQTHLDGDPKPRPSEIANWNAARKKYGLDDFLCQILVPDESVADGPMPGYRPHWWRLFERDGEAVVEPTEVDLQSIPDGTPGAAVDPNDGNNHGDVFVASSDDALARSRVLVKREEDDPEGVLRVSIGGTREDGYYYVFRGDPEACLDAVREALVEAEAQLRPPTTALTTDGKGRPYDWDEIHQQMMDNDRDQYAFRVTRQRQDDLTFSAVALEGLARQVLAFVMGRVRGYWKRTGKPARDLTLYVDLRLEHDMTLPPKLLQPVRHIEATAPVLGPRGPYGTNEGDIWSAEDSEVGKRLKEESGGVLIHEMLRVDGELDERIYWVEEGNPDPEIQDLIRRARKGTELYWAARAEQN